MVSEKHLLFKNNSSFFCSGISFTVFSNKILNTDDFINQQNEIIISLNAFTAYFIFEKKIS